MQRVRDRPMNFFRREGVHRLFLFLILLLFLPAGYAKSMVQKSQQMIVVTTANWNTLHGVLQRYERQKQKQPWQKIGAAIPVVVGQNGMAWGVENKNQHTHLKREGDNRTPVGIYSIGPNFGFHPQPIGKLNYVPLLATTECVDDTASHYYGQLVDSATIANKDWKSSEKMREISLYQIGSLIQYNTQQIARGGSCIFLHRWRSATKGTAGCIAMAASPLRTILQWLDAKKNPIIVTRVMGA